jgi:amidohydrolase
MVELAAVKNQIDEVVARHADRLIQTSRQIHAEPELGFAEHAAHDLLCEVLGDAGLEVSRGAYGLPTAFEAVAGTAGPRIAVLCEYDALPGIGHACGHNIIGTAGVGAGIAAAALAEDLGGTVVVLGTPAEEGGGGKVALAERGAFEGIDAALMVHPAGFDLSRFAAIAIQQLEVTYHGRAAHAAAAPHAGRNALDAAVLGYVNVAALRQHIRPDERIHGIFTEAGEAPNVVPVRAAATWYVRSPTVRGLQKLKARVLACLEAGSEAAGCTMEHQWLDPAYADMVDNEVMIGLYRDNLARTGRTLSDPTDLQSVIGSTDMGNISHLVPSIHPMIAVSPPNVPIHTRDFAVCAGSEAGDLAVLDGARALAGTVVDLWTSPEAMAAVRDEFQAARADGRATGSAVVGAGREA